MLSNRLSINSLSSFNWTFDEELALWRELGARRAGLLISKIADDVPGKLGRLREAGIEPATIVCGSFALGEPDTWAATRATLHRLIDAVAADGSDCSIYSTPGRSTGERWEAVLERFVAAIGPSVEYARRAGVQLAFEPSLRTDASFVNSLRDAVDVAAETGLGLVVDICNCWMERDLAGTIRRAAPYISLVQIGDAAIARPGGRVHIGDGDLPVAQFIEEILATGYRGVFDLEVLGPAVEAEGYAVALRRGVPAAAELLRRFDL